MTITTIDYPKPWLLLWAMTVLGLLYMSFAFYRLWRGWMRGIRQKSSKKNRKPRIFVIWFSEVFLQRQLFTLSFFRWVTHILIFWGFAALLSLSFANFALKTAVHLGLGSGLDNFFRSGTGYAVVKMWADGAGFMLLIGLSTAVARRYLLRPAQLLTAQTDTALLIYLLWMTLSGFILEGLRLSLVPAEIARYSFIGRFFIPAGTHTLAELGPWLTALWSQHAASGAALLLYLPHGKLSHSVLAPFVIALNAAEESEREDIYWPDIRKQRPTPTE